MNTLHILFFITSAISMLFLNDAAPTNANEEKLIIRGRVTFFGGSNALIESGAKLTVALQDTSLADAPAKTIAQGTGTATRFPMAFAIRYSPSQVSGGVSYSLRVTIKKQKDELLYTNDVYAMVIPLGVNRTKFIDVPVIYVTSSTPVPNKSVWPELVGTNGKDAVEIIKTETGFTNVEILKEGSPATLDYRSNRVRVIVNDAGFVTRAPVIG